MHMPTRILPKIAIMLTIQHGTTNSTSIPNIPTIQPRHKHKFSNDNDIFSMLIIELSIWFKELHINEIKQLNIV